MYPITRPLQLRDNSTVSYTDGRTPERRILQAMRSADDVRADSDELMSLVHDWPSYYHLGVGRSAILRPLELPADARVLEIGAGCGAITRYLGEQCAQVEALEGTPVRAEIADERCRGLDNVSIQAGDFAQLVAEPVYDLVVVVGVLEYAPIYFAPDAPPREACLAFLRHTVECLNPSGQLILAIENRLGAKYWAGFPEDHTGRLFEGIHGYPAPDTPITFSRAGLSDLLTESGLAKQRFYYCFPDYHFATTVLSDHGDEAELALNHWVDAPFQSLARMRQYLFDETLATASLCRAGLLREFANSFLVAASPGDFEPPEPDWTVKKYQMRRPEPLRAVTTLYPGPPPVVTKEPLHGGRVYRVGAGDLTIEQRLGQAPWRPGVPLTLEFNRAKLTDQFDTYVRDTLDGYHRRLLESFGLGRNDPDGFPLLKPGALDSLFSNVLVDGDDWHFIDEEWYADRPLPVDFVLYRCIRFCLYHHGWGEGRCRREIRRLYPEYGRRRHRTNRRLADDIQEATVGNMNPKLILSGLQGLSRHRLLWSVLSKAWARTPAWLRAVIRERV